MKTHCNRFLTATAMIAAACMALSGCGTANDGGQANGSADTANGGTVEISYMHRLDNVAGTGRTVNEIVSDWNEDHPDIHVTATKFDGKASEMIKKLEADVKNGSAPDLAQVGYSELPEVYTKGILQDVTEYAEQYKDHFASGPYDLMSLGGKYFGLPQDTGPLVYFYNQAEFEKLGISVPKTQEELIQAAKKAAAAGKYIMSFQPDEAGNMLPGLAGASGPWYTVEDDSWIVNTQTAGSQAVADVYQELLDADAVAVKPRWDPSFDVALQNESLIGTIGAAWEVPALSSALEGAANAKGNWRVAQIGDWFGNEGKTGPDGGSGVVVLKNSKHPAEAMEFLDWFNTQVDDLTDQSLVVAATTKAAKTPSSWSAIFGDQDVIKEFSIANDNMGSFNYMPGFSAVVATMTETASKVGEGSATMTDVFATAQTTSVDTLKNLNLSVK